MWRLLFRRFVKDKCDKTKGMLSAYIDQHLSLREQKEVEQHLEACQRCQEELDSLRATVGLLHRVPQVLPSRSFAVAEVEPLPRRKTFPALRTATAIAAAFLVLVFTSDLLNLFEGVPSLVEEEGASSQLGPGEGSEEGYLSATKNGATQEEGPTRDEEPGLPPGEEELAREEADWLPPLEYSLLGVVVVLGGMTIATWKKGKKRSFARG